MKKIFLLILIIVFTAGNIFAQNDSSSIHKTNKIDSKVKAIQSGKFGKNISMSKKDTGILIGALVGAGAGALFGVWAGSFSLEPSNDKKASLGTVLVCSMIGAVMGGIIGGVTTKE